MKLRERDSAAARIESAAAGWIVRRERGLTAAECAEFEHWQAEDPRHAEALARKEQAWAVFDRPRGAGQAGLLLDRLADRAARRRRRRFGATVTAVAVLGGAGLLWQIRDKAVESPDQSRGIVVLPERRICSDGSAVELRAGAEIAVDFSGPQRRVALKRGEAHFQVARDITREFVVEANGVEVRAVGTAFSVEWGSTAVQVLVTEGRVAVDKVTSIVRRAHAASEVSPTFVDAGSAARLETGPQSAAVAVVTPMDATEIKERLAWRAPKVEFSEMPLGKAVALMNRHSRVQFLIEDPALARLPVSGVFRADNTETFVRLLEGSFGITASRSGDTILLRPNP